MQELSELFRILGDPTRIRVLTALREGPLCVSELVDSLGMSQSSISHQLSILRHSRLVRFERSGRQLFYSLDDSHVVSLLEMGLEHVREQ